MKKPLPYIVICLVIGLLVIVGLSLNKNESALPDSEAQLEDTIQATEENASSGVSSISTISEPDFLEGLVEGSPEWWRKGYETPIDFYGLVLDQEDRPVAGAEVTFSWNPLDSDGENLVVKSDANGRVKFLGRKGLYLGVRVSKEGYYQIKTEGGSLQSFDFFVTKDRTPDHLSDPNDPAILRLMKKGEGVDLITSEFRNKLPPSGEAKIDLLNGRLSSNGQLELSIERLSKEWHFPWTAKATIKGGGFVKAEGQFMHEAPAEGYVEDIIWSFPLNEEGRQERFVIKENYYIKFGSPPRYGRIVIYLKSHNKHLLLESHVNPDGERNLEPKSQ